MSTLSFHLISPTQRPFLTSGHPPPNIFIDSNCTPCKLGVPAPSQPCPVPARTSVAAWVRSDRHGCCSRPGQATTELLWRCLRAGGCRAPGVAQAQPHPTESPDEYWQSPSEEMLSPRRKRSACSCPDNEWLGYRPGKPVFQQLPQVDKGKTRSPPCKRGNDRPQRVATSKRGTWIDHNGLGR